MTKNLYEASRQWATRPDDERFSSLPELLTFAKQKRDRSRQSVVDMKKLSFELHQDDVVLKGENSLASFTHWSFGQLCARLRVPAEFVRSQPADLAVENLRFGLNRLAQNDPDRQAKLLLSVTSNDKVPFRVRAFNGPNYSRIWDYQMIERVMELGKDWKVPPAYNTKTGQVEQGCAGLYASDRDCFIFLVNEENRINDGSDTGLARGFFLSNSEVGAGAWDLTHYLYQFVCGNHIVWNAEQVTNFKIRHVGMADIRSTHALEQALDEYSNASAKPLEDHIRKARTHVLADSDEALEDKLFSLRILPRKTIREALEEAKQSVLIGTEPRSAWGMAQGVTRVARKEPHADKRLQLDMAARSIMDMVA